MLPRLMICAMGNFQNWQIQNTPKRVDCTVTKVIIHPPPHHPLLSPHFCRLRRISLVKTPVNALIMQTTIHSAEVHTSHPVKCHKSDTPGWHSEKIRGKN